MPEPESVVLSIKRYEQTVKVVAKYCLVTILFPPASSLGVRPAETFHGQRNADANTARVGRGAADRVAGPAFP